ncbi:hypothetical protein KM043_016696 [Ampulex compressa]|nr:hypothetical protein KM043_016696 [Ampulex compressa]
MRIRPMRRRGSEEEDTQEGSGVHTHTQKLAGIRHPINLLLANSHRPIAKREDTFRFAQHPRRPREAESAPLSEEPFGQVPSVSANLEERDRLAQCGDNVRDKPTV